MPSKNIALSAAIQIEKILEQNNKRVMIIIFFGDNSSTSSIRLYGEPNISRTMFEIPAPPDGDHTNFLVLSVFDGFDTTQPLWAGCTYTTSIVIYENEVSEAVMEKLRAKGIDSVNALPLLAFLALAGS